MTAQRAGARFPFPLDARSSKHGRSGGEERAAVVTDKRRARRKASAAAPRSCVKSSRTLGLHGDGERRDRLVSDQHLGCMDRGRGRCVRPRNERGLACIGLP